MAGIILHSIQTCTRHRISFQTISLSSTHYLPCPLHFEAPHCLSILNCFAIVFPSLEQGNPPCTKTLHSITRTPNHSSRHGCTINAYHALDAHKGKACLTTMAKHIPGNGRMRQEPQLLSSTHLCFDLEQRHLALLKKL